MALRCPLGSQPECRRGHAKMLPVFMPSLSCAQPMDSNPHSPHAFCDRAPWTPRDLTPPRVVERIQEQISRDELVQELQAYLNEKVADMHQDFRKTLTQLAIHVAQLQKAVAGRDCEKIDLRKTVDDKISKFEDNLHDILGQHIGQQLAERDCKMMNFEASVDSKISKLEDAVAAGIADINCVKHSLEELADGLEEGVQQVILSGMESLKEEVADIRRSVLCQATLNSLSSKSFPTDDQLQEDGLHRHTEDNAQRASSCKPKVDVVQNCMEVQQEIQATLAQCAVQFQTAKAEREQQDHKMSNFEARLDLKVSQLDAAITAGLASINGFNTSPMALIGSREKQRLMSDIESKLKLTTSVMENEIAVMRADMKGLQKAAHNWHEFKTKSGDNSNEASTRVSSESGEECEVSDGSS